MEFLKNLNGSDSVINTLINKIFDITGWVINRDTPKRIATKTFIEEIQKEDIDPLRKAAIISHTNQIIKEYCNQNDIVKMAIPLLQNNAMPEKIENDWLNKFFDKAKLASSEEFQAIWGVILAKECNEPGSIPCVLLNTLDSMDKEDANAFISLCRVSVQVEGAYSPIVVYPKFDAYKELVGLDYSQLVNLRSLGLIEIDMGMFSTGYEHQVANSSVKLAYFENQCEIIGESTIKLGNVLYTKSGNALCCALFQSVEMEEVKDFWHTYCLPLWYDDQKNKQL